MMLLPPCRYGPLTGSHCVGSISWPERSPRRRSWDAPGREPPTPSQTAVSAVSSPALRRAPHPRGVIVRFTALGHALRRSGALHHALTVAATALRRRAAHIWGVTVFGSSRARRGCRLRSRRIGRVLGSITTRQQHKSKRGRCKHHTGHWRATIHDVFPIISKRRTVRSVRGPKGAFEFRCSVAAFSAARASSALIHINDDSPASPLAQRRSQGSVRTSSKPADPRARTLRAAAAEGLS
jgi:hypothetical protein